MGRCSCPQSTRSYRKGERPGSLPLALSLPGAPVHVPTCLQLTQVLDTAGTTPGPQQPRWREPLLRARQRPTGCRGGGRIRAGFFRVPPTQRRPLSPEHERAGAGALSALPSHPVTARDRVLLYELRAADGNTDSKVGTALLQVAVAAATRAPRWLIAAAPDAPGDGGAELGEGSMSGPFGANSCSGGRCWSQEA